MQDKSIGGFIELEFYNGKGPYHTNAIKLATGRACLSLFLETYKPRMVYLPYYTCNTLIDPLIINKTPFKFFEIDKDLNPLFSKNLKDNEYLLYINYFDIKNSRIAQLEKEHGSKLIIDNTQAFYHENYKQAIASFNSGRKFFGVPDGGYLYSKKEISRKLKRNENYTIAYLLSRSIGKTEVYYNQFLENEKKLNSQIAGMSSLSETILDHTDYLFCAKKRIENFHFLHNHLSKHNQFLIDAKSISVPYAYPFLPAKFIDRSKFYNKRLFISTLWLDVLNRGHKGFKTEKYLSANLLPLPIDQRYGEKEMQIVIKLLKPYL
jgi:hypothetical protein